jgi:hypothetical protein
MKLARLLTKQLEKENKERLRDKKQALGDQYQVTTKVAHQQC